MTYSDNDTSQLKEGGEDDGLAGQGGHGSASDLEEQRQGRALGLGQVVAGGTGEEGQQGQNERARTDGEGEGEALLGGDARGTVDGNTGLEFAGGKRALFACAGGGKGSTNRVIASLAAKQEPKERWASQNAQNRAQRKKAHNASQTIQRPNKSTGSPIETAQEYTYHDHEGNGGSDVGAPVETGCGGGEGRDEEQERRVSNRAARWDACKREAGYLRTGPQKQDKDGMNRFRTKTRPDSQEHRGTSRASEEAAHVPK